MKREQTSIQPIPDEQNEHCFVADLRDPRLTNEERQVLYDVGTRRFGKPSWNIEDVVLKSVDEVEADAEEILTKLRRVQTGAARAAILIDWFTRERESDDYSVMDSDELDALISENYIDSYTLSELLGAAIRWDRRTRASVAADIRHANSRIKRLAVRELWASGKYSSRDICAEQECASIGMSFSSARKALRGTPDNS